MSFSLDITFKGINGSQSALKQFEQDIPEQVTDFLETMGQIVVEEMQSDVPIDTGELHDSIDYNVSGTDLTFEATADHAGFVEYGTRNMEPQPYFNPPIDRNLGSSGITDQFGKDALANWDKLVNEFKDQ